MSPACAIQKSNVKVFARALHCLARIGEEVFLRLDEQGLTVKTVSPARSAMASILFMPTFFSSYRSGCNENEEDDADDDDEDEDRDEIRERGTCKLSMKSLVWVFKSISGLEKTVETASLEIERDLVKFKLLCRRGVTKTFSIFQLEGRGFKFNADASALPRFFRASSRSLSEAVANFLTSQEEVTMTAMKEKFMLRNHVDSFAIEQRGSAKPVRTELTMRPSDFNEYHVEGGGEHDVNGEMMEDAGMTFCMKEFRALIAFADAFKLDVSARFFKAGSPLILSVFWPGNCRVSLAMATMCDPNDKRPSTAISMSQRSQSSVVGGPSNLSAIRQGRPSYARRDSLPTPPMASTMRPSASPAAPSSPNTSIVAAPIEAHLGASPVIAERSFKDKTNAAGPNGDANASPAKEPPSKRARLVFKKVFETTFYPAEASCVQRVLAPDSDEEEQEA